MPNLCAIVHADCCCWLTAGKFRRTSTRPSTSALRCTAPASSGWPSFQSSLVPRMTTRYSLLEKPLTVCRSMKGTVCESAQVGALLRQFGAEALKCGLSFCVVDATGVILLFSRPFLRCGSHKYRKVFRGKESSFIQIFQLYSLMQPFCTMPFMCTHAHNICNDFCQETSSLSALTSCSSHSHLGYLQTLDWIWKATYPWYATGCAPTSSIQSLISVTCVNIVAYQGLILQFHQGVQANAAVLQNAALSSSPLPCPPSPYATRTHAWEHMWKSSAVLRIVWGRRMSLDFHSKRALGRHI